MDTNEAIVPLQSETAKIIGLGSSDELSITNVQASEPDSLGSQRLTYRATTNKGRSFDCSATMTPGLLLSKPSVSAPTCTPIQVHN